MKLKEMLQADIGLDEGEVNTAVRVVQQWLTDQAHRHDRAGHTGETIRDLVTDLHTEMIAEEEGNAEHHSSPLVG